jgi:hypothetical protein
MFHGSEEDSASSGAFEEDAQDGERYQAARRKRVRDIRVSDSREFRPVTEICVYLYLQPSSSGGADPGELDENADLLTKVEADQGVGPRTRASAPPSNPMCVTLKSRRRVLCTFEVIYSQA